MPVFVDFKECIMVAVFPPFPIYFCWLFVALWRFFTFFFNRFCLFSFARVVILVDKLKKFVGSKKRLFFLCHNAAWMVDACSVCVCVKQLLTYIYELFSVWTTNNQQATTASCNRPLIALEIHSTMALKNAHMRIPKGGIWSHQMQPFFHCSMPTLFVVCVWYCPRIDRITMPVTRC